MDITALKLLFSFFPHFSLIAQLFKNNYIHDGIFINCHNNLQIMVLQKAFSVANIKMLAVKDENFGKHIINIKKTKVGIVIDASCKGWINVLEGDLISDRRINWIINTNNLNSTITFLSKLQLRIDSNIVLINNNSKGFNVHEVYNTGFKRNGIFVVRNIGFWHSSLFTRERSDSRNNLNGAVLKCVSVITDRLKETYMHFLEESKHDKTDTLHKLKFYTVIRYLQEMYNFSVKVQRTNSWGYSHNGSFDGLIGALQRQEAEFGCSPVLFKINRAEVVNYVVPTWKTKHTFLFRQPKYQASYYTVYTRPLNGVVWQCMLGVLLIAGLTLTLIFKVKKTKVSLDKDTSFSLIWLLICSAVCQQGMPVNKNAVSARIIIFVTFMFSMMVYQFYNANVLSSLLNDQYEYIRSLKDLLQSDLKAGVEDMLFNKDYFKRTTDQITLDLYKAKIATDKYYNFFDAEYGMGLVKRGGFAFHVDTSAAYPVMRRSFSEREICEVGEVQLFPAQYVGAVAVKGSQYREYIAVGVSKLLETGLMNRIKSVWESRKPPCTKQRYGTIISVDIPEFSMPLLFLVCGFMSSLLILLFEIFTNKVKRRIRYRNVGRLHFKKDLHVYGVKGVIHNKPLRKKITFLIKEPGVQFY